MNDAIAKNVISLEVVFNGIKFRRYPLSKRYCDRNYYKPNGTHIVAGVESLHHEVWKQKNGPIPVGHHIHHKDGNADNNSINNLECISREEHQKIHPSKGHYGEELKKMLDAGRIWHKTEEGKKFHREHAKRIWENRTINKYKCKICGKDFNTKSNRAYYCGPKCRQYDYDLEKRYTSDFKCALCGKDFKTRNKNAECCSRSCAAKLQSKRGMAHDVKTGRFQKATV